MQFKECIIMAFKEAVFFVGVIYVVQKIESKKGKYI